MSQTMQFNPKKVALVYGGIPALHVEGIKVTPSAPMTTSTVLIDGSEVVNVSNDNSAEIEVTLAQASATNNIYSADVTAAKVLGTIVFKPFLLKDLNGTTLMSADQSYLTGYSDVEFGKDSSTRVWKIRCSSLKTVIGGHL